MVKYGKGPERVNRTDRESEKKVRDSKHMSWSERYTPLKSIKNGVSLGTVADSPESSREGEGGSSDTFCTLNVDPCTTLP